MSVMSMGDRYRCDQCGGTADGTVLPRGWMLVQGLMVGDGEDDRPDVLTGEHYCSIVCLGEALQELAANTRPLR